MCLWENVYYAGRPLARRERQRERGRERSDYQRKRENNAVCREDSPLTSRSIRILGRSVTRIFPRTELRQVPSECRAFMRRCISMESSRFEASNSLRTRRASPKSIPFASKRARTGFSSAFVPLHPFHLQNQSRMSARMCIRAFRSLVCHHIDNPRSSILRSGSSS